MATTAASPTAEPELRNRAWECESWTGDLDRVVVARSTALLGDPKRDQGAVLGPPSAQHPCADARAVITHPDMPRRVAQLDLSLAVVTEVSGKLEIAARSCARHPAVRHEAPSNRVRVIWADAPIGATLPGSSWQRCRTHYARNLMPLVPKSAVSGMMTLLLAVFEQPDAEAIECLTGKPGTPVSGGQPSTLGRWAM